MLSLVRTSLFCLLLALLARVVLHSTSSNADIISGDSGTQQRILLLTAHPDDECLFFAPTISSLLAQAHEGKSAPEIYSLCLSVGNADGLGGVRRKELADSLDVLGIDTDKRWVLDHPDLPDNITQTWDEAVLSDVVKPFVLENRITTILTFDHSGISSHPNHASLPRGAIHLAASLPISSRPRVFALITVPLVHKYIGPLAAVLAKSDLWLASMLQTQDPHHLPVFVSGVDGYKIALRAMKQHASQLVWFRWLYVSFSRYMWVNEWIELAPPSDSV